MHEPAEDRYRILRIKNQRIEGGRRWTTAWMLSEYVKCTDELIGRMDGSIALEAVPVDVLEHERWSTPERDLPPPTAMLWLDKSARPVSWFVRAFWPLLAGDPGSMGPRPARPRGRVARG